MLLLKINLLLWGLSAVFATESTGTSTPDILTIITTTEPSKQTVELIGEHHEMTSHTPAEVSVSAAAAAQTTVRAAAETEEASDSHVNDGMVAVVTVATTVSSSGTQLRHSSPAAHMVSSKAPISDTTKPTTVRFEQKTTTTPSVTTSATDPEPTPTTEPELPSKSSPATSTTHSTQSLGSPSAPTSTATVNSTSESLATAASTSTPEPPTSQSSIRTSNSIPEHPSTSQPSTRTPTSTPEHPTTSQPSTRTPTSTPDAGHSSLPTLTTTSLSTNSTNTTSITIVSTIPGIIINPKKQPTSTTKPPPPPTTTEPTQSCSTRSTVRQCLIVVASLAFLATIFMVTTIVLCAKLSAMKHRTRRPQQDTEMMCISSLLPDRTYNYTRQHNHITNGILVMHRATAHDDDSEDNVTLSSFLPDNDRYV